MSLNATLLNTVITVMGTVH